MRKRYGDGIAGGGDVVGERPGTRTCGGGAGNANVIGEGVVGSLGCCCCC